ncbi:hypothetical protein [Micromonospora sp. SH-82]|uniref:hypothetical protein n=1 Tax=Micromonospora sp. SH-82 TaxID=3132938 RepID=UPI003EBE2704
MQPDAPYRFTEVMGGCRVGEVWWATDGQDRLVTVAVLDPEVAQDPAWRQAFVGMADALAAPGGGGRSYLAADVSGRTPWVAYTADGGPGAEHLFVALGHEIRREEPTPQASGPPYPVSPSGGQASGPPYQPVSGVPHDPFSAPTRRIQPSPPRPRRTGLWVGAAALVLVVLAGTGAAFVWLDPDTPDTPQAAPTTTVEALPPPPSAPPQAPGIEPPAAGQWPRDWPRFTPQDPVRTVVDLADLGFALKVPPEWTCTPAGKAEGYVKYTCGVSGGQGELGGELVVRDCVLPCDEQRQTAMRQAEEAWGLQWIRGGQFVSYADSSRLDLDGERRYGLVVVAYVRGGDTGRVDRQVVLRMTAPIDGAGRLRRVANHLRDALIF